MAIKMQRSDMAMSDFRNEFLGTSSGEIKMSDLVRAIPNDASNSTRNAGNTGGDIRMSNNALSPTCVGVYVANTSKPSAGTTPTYTPTYPKTSTADMAFSDYNGVSGSFPSSKWSLSSPWGEMFGNSGSQGSSTSYYISRNIDYSNAVKFSGTNTEDGFGMCSGYKIMNTTAYQHQELGTVANPGDVMFLLTCSNSGANFTSAAFYPSKGTSGTLSTSAVQCSNLWQGQSNNAYEFQDGNDRVTYCIAKRCLGGETHSSFYVYSSAANSGVYFGWFTGIIRTNTTTGSGENTYLSHMGVTNNTEFSLQMGTVYGHGEALIIGDLGGYSTNNPAITTNTSTSDHIMQSEFSISSTNYGPLSASAGLYEESVDLVKGSPTAVRTLKCRTGTTDNLQFQLRVNTNN
jgi:hypothetical protein